MLFAENLEFFFNLSEKVEVFAGKTKVSQRENITSDRELIEIELEKLERLDNEQLEASLEAIFSLCFGKRRFLEELSNFVRKWP